MKNIIPIKEAFDRVTRSRHTMTDGGKTLLLADLILADRCFEINWGYFIIAKEKRFFDEVENLRRYADHENFCFRDDFEPYYSEG
jgi:hypothetical protein